MSKQGWISIHRGIQDHWVWSDKPYDKAHAWIDLILTANHKPAKVPLGSEFINVDRGSFITSELKLMDKWGWSKTKVRSFLKLLENDSMIVKKSDNKKTTITIVNYTNYQDMQTTEEPKKDFKKTSKKLQKNTNNNDNNDNNENKYNTVPKGFIPPALTEIQSYCLERKNSVDSQRFLDFYESKGWYIGKNKMKDWKAAVRTWENKDDNKNKGSTPTVPFKGIVIKDRE